MRSGEIARSCLGRFGEIAHLLGACEDPLVQEVFAAPLARGPGAALVERARVRARDVEQSEGVAFVDREGGTRDGEVGGLEWDEWRCEAEKGGEGEGLCFTALPSRGEQEGGGLRLERQQGHRLAARCGELARAVKSAEGVEGLEGVGEGRRRRR